MSVKASNWAWDVEKLSTTQRVVLVKLADGADSQRFTAYPSVAFLAEKACCSPRTVERTLAQLMAPRPGYPHGLISRRPWEGKNGSRKGQRDVSTFLYTLHVRDDASPRHGDGSSEQPAPDTVTGRQIVGGDTDDSQPPTSVQPAPDIGDRQPPTLATIPPHPPTKEESTAEPTSEPTAGTVTEVLTHSVTAPTGGHVHSVECECHPKPLRLTLNGDPDLSAVVVLVPLSGSEGRPMAVTEGLLAKLQADYPAVDALGCARHLRNWMLRNPRRRSVPAGIGNRIVTWWQREQERAARGRSEFARAAGNADAAVQRKVAGLQRFVEGG